MMDSEIKLEVVGIEKKTGALEEINEGPEFKVVAALLLIMI